ncbi:MAG: lipoyl(octanoyl) transferase LipB [Chromatiales bacterium]
MTAPLLNIRTLGELDYREVWNAMQAFTSSREPGQVSELWLVEHPPVFTQGQAGKAEHVLDAGTIPVVQTDRGGQVTYHGPGQLVCYLLLDLDEIGIGIRSLVYRTEQAIIRLLDTEGIKAERRKGAPGVYTANAKIAQIGLRVKRHHTYHGLSLNIGMDLDPFERINPCGYAGLAVTDMRSQGSPIGMEEAGKRLCGYLAEEMGYTIGQSFMRLPGSQHG